MHLSQEELTFCAGDVITVFGEIDEDGFYYVSTLLCGGFERVSTLSHAKDAKETIHRERHFTCDSV